MKHELLLEHRNIVNELQTAIDVIKEGWKSPDDVWWIKIEQRLKDYKHFNTRHNYAPGSPNFKHWGPVNGHDSMGRSNRMMDSTHRENHVGYVIVRGKTADDAVNSLKYATVHLHPWTLKYYKKPIETSNGNMEAIVKVCNFFFSRAYMVLSPRSMKQVIDRARIDKQIGRFPGREFHHRIGQPKEYNDRNNNWEQLHPWGMIDCDVDDVNGQKDLERFLAKNNITPFRSYLSHDGKHYLFKDRSPKNLNFGFMAKYGTLNRAGDPPCEFKGDANMMIYSATGV